MYNPYLKPINSLKHKKMYIHLLKNLNSHVFCIQYNLGHVKIIIANKCIKKLMHSISFL